MRYKFLIVFLHIFLICEATNTNEEIIGAYEIELFKKLTCQCIDGGMFVTVDDQFFLSKICTFTCQDSKFTFYNIVKKDNLEDEEILPASNLEAIEHLLHGILPYLSGQLEKNITEIYDIFDRDAPKAIELVDAVLAKPILFQDIWYITEESLSKKLYKVIKFLNKELNVSNGSSVPKFAPSTVTSIRINP